MARAEFGRGTADWIIVADEEDAEGIHPVLLPNTEVTFWDSFAGGSQYTDLEDAGGNPVSSVSTNGDGMLPVFFGPSTEPTTVELWAQAGAGPRFRLISVAAAELAQEAAEQAGQAVTEAEAAAATVSGFESRLVDVENETDTLGNGLSDLQAQNNDQQDEINENRERIEDLEAGPGFVTLASLMESHVNEPIMVGHRGGRFVYPENSIMGLRRILDSGIKMAEIDIWGTVDDDLFVMHDSTTGRTVDYGPGGTSLFTESVTRNARRALGHNWAKDPVAVFGHKHNADGTSPVAIVGEMTANGGRGTPPNLREVFENFAGKMCFYLELKNARAGQLVEDLVREYKMENSVVVAALYEQRSWLTPVNSTDIPTLVFASTILDSSARTDLVNSGVGWVNYSVGANPTLSDVQNLISSGLGYAQTVGTLHSVFAERVANATTGGNLLMTFALSDYPVYHGGKQRILSGYDHVSGAVGRNNPTSGGAYLEGMHPSGENNAGGVFSTNSAHQTRPLFFGGQNFDASGGDVMGVHCGWNPFIFDYNPAVDTLIFSVRFFISAPSSSDVGGRIYVAMGTNDRMFNAVSNATNNSDALYRGYHFWYAQNGACTIARHDGGSSTSLGSTTNTSYGSGAERRITLRITPTQIRGFRAAIDNPRSPTGTNPADISDTTYRGPYFWFGSYRSGVRIEDVHIEKQ